MFLQTALIIKIRNTMNTHLINYNKLFTPLSSVKKSEILTDIRSPHQDHIDSDMDIRAGHTLVKNQKLKN